MQLDNAIIPSVGPGGTQIFIDAGTVRVTGAGVASFFFNPSVNSVSVDAGGTLDLNGFSTVLRNFQDGANGGGTITNDGAAATLIVNSANSTTFSGVIADGAGATSLTKDLAGTLTLSGANTYSGGTTISAGRLQLGNGGTTGSIEGSVVNNAALAFMRSNTYTFDGVISGTGSVSQDGIGTIVLTNTNTYLGNTNVNAGTLVVNGSIASATTVNDGGTLKGTGQLGGVTVLGSGVYAPGNSIGTQTVNGAFALNPGAVFEVEVNAAGQSDRVIVNGTVNLTGSVLRVLAENGNYKPRTDYLIVDNDGSDAVVGQFASVTSSLAFLTPSVIYNAGTGNDVVLTMARIVTPNGPLSFCSVATTTNQCNVARALDQFPTDDPLFLAVLNQTAEGARQAFDALSGEIHATVAGVLADESRYVREAVLGRLIQASYTSSTGQFASLGAGGPQVASLNSRPTTLGSDSQAMALGHDGKHLAMPPSTPNLAFWTRAYGAWGDFEGNGNAASANRDLGGFVSGMDAQVSDTWRVGLAAGGARSNVSVGERYSSAEVESTHLAGYAGGMVGPLALRTGGAWAWNDIDTTRAVIFPGFFEREESSYDADTGQIFGEIAYPIASGRIAFEPFAGLAFVTVETDSFRERGELAALTGGSNTQEIGYSTLGLRAATVLQVSGATVIPKISAAWQHVFDDVTPDAALAFASTGIGFGVTGVPLAEDSLLIEAGLDFALTPNATLGVSYSGQLADDVEDNAVKGRLTWLF